MKHNANFLIQNSELCDFFFAIFLLERKMSEQVEMEEDDRGSSILNSNVAGGEKKRFEVKKVTVSFFNASAFQ